MAFTRDTVRVEGFSELKDALDDFSKATSGNILKRAVSQAAAIVAEEAARKAPFKRGALKRGIMVGKAKIISAGKGAFAAALAEGATRAEAAAAARAANASAGGAGRAAVASAGPLKSLRQAVPQEFGTFNHSAHPYMRPAWDATQGKCLAVMKEALKDEIDKASARARKKAARLLNKK